MGLKEGHPEKDGVLVDLDMLPLEIKIRLDKKKARGPGEDEQIAEKLATLDMTCIQRKNHLLSTSSLSQRRYN
jgi:hypothetical protein